MGMRIVSVFCFVVMLAIAPPSHAQDWHHNPALMGDAVGPYMYNGPTACKTTAGILLYNPSGLIIHTVEWFRWARAQGAVSPDPITWQAKTGSAGLAPIVGTVLTKSALINNGLPNTDDDQLIITNSGYASPMQWGIWSVPSMYVVNPVVGMRVFKMSIWGYIEGTIVATNQKYWASYGPYNGRAPLGTNNLCEFYDSTPFWMVNHVAATFSATYAVDLGASVQTLDGTLCHHPVFNIGTRSLAVVVGGRTVYASAGDTTAGTLANWGAHVAGGNTCEPSSIHAPVINSELLQAPQEFVQRVDEVHDPHYPDWDATKVPASPRQAAAEADLEKKSQAFVKAHPELPKRLSPTLQAEYDRVGAIGNQQRYNCLEYKWHAQSNLSLKERNQLSQCLNANITRGDEIPLHQIGPDVENGRVVMQIVIQGQPTQAQKQIIKNDLGGHWSMDGVPVVIHSISVNDVTGAAAAVKK